MKNKFILITLIMGLLTTAAFATGNGDKSVERMPFLKPELTNMEYAVYSQYQGGSKTVKITVVTEIEGDLVHKYVNYYYYGNSVQKEPESYKDFEVKITTSLKNGCMVAYQSDTEEYVKANDYTGMVYENMTIDQETGDVKHQQKIWDGYEDKTTRSRLTIKPGFPSFALRTIAFDNLQFLDVETSGLVYLILPDMIADPIEGTINVLGRETLETEAGTFETIKISLAPGDAFVKKLLGPLADALVLWVEDAPTRRTIKTIIPGVGQTLVLDEKGIWKE